MQENGGRKDRELLLEDGSATEMDMSKVLEWVKDSKLASKKTDTEPRGHDRLRKTYAERENGNYPATPTENKYVGKMHIAR